MQYLYLFDINLVTVAFILFWAAVALGSAMGLRRTNSDDVQTVWYFFSLSFVITLLAVIWGNQHGAFDAHGETKGEAGHILSKLLEFISDSETDAKIIGFVLAVLVAPQVLSYIFSSLFGCASSVWFVEAGIKFALWSVVKFFTVLSGVVCSLAIFGPSKYQIDDNFVVALMLITLAFAPLFLYRKTEIILARLGALCPATPRRWLRVFHQWATRNRASQVVKHSEA
jgi:hypothetical protein